MKKQLFIALAFALFCLTFNVSAQKKQRIGLEEGADSVQVKGKITGKQYALYEIYVSKSDVWEVNLSSANNYIGYTVKTPNGDRYDFLEPAPQEGFYIIRVELNSSGAKSKSNADFSLDIKFEMKSGKPLN